MRIWLYCNEDVLNTSNVVANVYQNHVDCSLVWFNDPSCLSITSLPLLSMLWWSNANVVVGPKLISASSRSLQSFTLLVWQSSHTFGQRPRTEKCPFISSSYTSFLFITLIPYFLFVVLVFFFSSCVYLIVDPPNIKGIMMRPSHVSETALLNRCTKMTGSGNFKVETMVPPLCDMIESSNIPYMHEMPYLHHLVIGLVWHCLLHVCIKPFIHNEITTCLSDIRSLLE